MYIENALNHLSLLMAVLSISLLFSLLHYYLFRNKGPWKKLWAFFLVLLLIDWTFGLWYFLMLKDAQGIPWLLLTFVGFITTMLIAASTIQIKEHHYKTYEENTEVIVITSLPENAVLKRNLRYWLLLAFLSLSIIVAYLKIYFP